MLVQVVLMARLLKQPRRTRALVQRDGRYPLRDRHAGERVRAAPGASRTLMTAAAPLGWIGIVRLGLVQTALGSVVVLTTSTLNRVMVVELALPAILPGAAGRSALRWCRYFGRGWAMAPMSAGGGRRGSSAAWRFSRWAASARPLPRRGWRTHPGSGIAFAVVAFVLIGLGVGASGTSLLVLLAKRVDAQRRAAAATIVWLMMIAGFAVTATVAGQLLDPFSPARLVGGHRRGVHRSLPSYAGCGLERRRSARGRIVRRHGSSSSARSPHSGRRCAQVWAEPTARRFTVFVFVSMLAYSAQDLILEPFAGSVFGYDARGVDEALRRSARRGACSA